MTATLADEQRLAGQLLEELEWWDAQDWDGLSVAERRSMLAEHIARTVRDNYWSPGPGERYDEARSQAWSNAVPCCDGRLGDDCRCECHVRKSPGAGLVSDRTVQDRTNT